VASLEGNLELLNEKINAHSHGINSVAFSLDGTKIESCPHAMAGRSKSGILVRRDRKITPPAKIDASWFAWHHACWIDGHAPPTPPTRLSAVTHVITATIAVCCAACNTTSRGVAGAYK
jgi:hypothetical protein